mmetsp:Transcript_93964/g.265928  ORF Transcript_93964/g.265928 Transcript_93964/m.265928 type:complete len:231 (-) Transcript_93964:268-960(-)
MPRTAARWTQWKVWFMAVSQAAGMSAGTLYSYSSSLSSFILVIAQLWISRAAGVMEMFIIASWYLLAAAASSRKHESRQALEWAKWRCVMASHLRMIMLPGLVGTSKTSASSSKGLSSSVPLMGPRGTMIMSLCRHSVESQTDASSRPSSGASSPAMPVSLTRPCVLVGHSKPSAGVSPPITAAVSDMATSSFLRPVGASPSSTSGLPNSRSRAEPSAPKRPSTISSGGL